MIGDEKERLTMFMSWMGAGVEDEDSESQGKESSHDKNVEGDLKPLSIDTGNS